MTHADTPYLAGRGMAAEGGAGGPGGKAADLFPAEEARRGPLAAVSEVSSQPLRHGPYGFKLDGVRELKGREVLRKESWGDWERVE
jgi:hypothetical protein